MLVKENSKRKVHLMLLQAAEQRRWKVWNVTDTAESNVMQSSVLRCNKAS
jgi:hypothetical protein